MEALNEFIINYDDGTRATVSAETVEEARQKSKTDVARNAFQSDKIKSILRQYYDDKIGFTTKRVG